jgi:RNA recognition motif-containing protein
VNIKNLSYRVTNEDLKREFQQFSAYLVETEVPVDKQGKVCDQNIEILYNSQGKGFGTIIFDDEMSVGTVLEFMQNVPIDRRPIKLYKVEDESRDSSWERPKNHFSSRTKKKKPQAQENTKVESAKREHASTFDVLSEE